MNDKSLIRKRNQINKIIRAPYRKGINYLRLIDMRKSIADQLFSNSFNRAMNTND